MFEASLLTLLKTDATLLTYLSTFSTSTGNVPSIFDRIAPETAVTPYLVYRIETVYQENLEIELFSIDFDYYDFNVIADTARNAVERLFFTLDRAHIADDTRYGLIRIYKGNAYPIEGADPRDLRYHITFSARAGRKKWMSII